MFCEYWNSRLPGWKREMIQVRNADHNSKENDAVNDTSVFLFGKLSATLIIPISIAHECGFTKSDSVIIEKKDEGLLIRKLRV